MEENYSCGFFSYFSRSKKSSSEEDVIEQTLVILKGDIIARRLMGEVISILESRFSIAAIKFITIDEDMIDKLYGGAKNREFYPGLKSYITKGYHVALIIEGKNAIQEMLTLKGKSPNDQAETLRKKYSINDLISSIHCSHNSRDAKREIRLFFTENEIHQKIPDITEYSNITQNISNNKK